MDIEELFGGSLFKTLPKPITAHEKPVAPKVSFRLVADKLFTLESVLLYS